MKIDEALDLYLVQIQADGRSQHTVAQYRRHVRMLASWLAARSDRDDVEEFGHEDLARFLASPTARTRPDGKLKMAASTNALRTSLRTFFRYLHDAGYVRINPARLIRRAMCSPSPPRSLSEAEQERLLATIAVAKGPQAERDHLLFHVMLATGIRVGSARAIDRSDVDLERGELRIRTAKGDRPEVVYLGRAVQDHLRRHTDGETGPMFAGRWGPPLSTRHVERRLAIWCERAGIGRRVTPHDLRHSFAIRIYRKTGDLLLVQQALGHRSVVSTTIYARFDEESLRAAVGGDQARAPAHMKASWRRLIP